MATGQARESATGEMASATPKIDSRAPRFGQAITASVLVVAVLLQVPELVYLIAGILGLAVVSKWRLDPYALLWRHGVSQAVSKPTEFEHPAPPRFAKLVGAGFTLAASAALVFGAPLVGYALATVVALLAELAATTGFCLGCRMYRQVSFFQRIGWL